MFKTTFVDNIAFRQPLIIVVLGLMFAFIMPWRVSLFLSATLVKKLSFVSFLFLFKPKHRQLFVPNEIFVYQIYFRQFQQYF